MLIVGNVYRMIHWQIIPSETNFTEITIFKIVRILRLLENYELFEKGSSKWKKNQFKSKLVDISWEFSNR